MIIRRKLGGPALCCAIGAVVAVASPLSADELFFMGLGDLPGGGLWSTAKDVSADGSTAVGFGTTGLFRFGAFRWTQDEGMVGLGYLPGRHFQ